MDDENRALTHVLISEDGKRWTKVGTALEGSQLHGLIAKIPDGVLVLTTKGVNINRKGQDHG